VLNVNIQPSWNIDESYIKKASIAMDTGIALLPIMQLTIYLPFMNGLFQYGRH